MFDEFEEWTLIMNHYCIVMASNSFWPSDSCTEVGDGSTESGVYSEHDQNTIIGEETTGDHQKQAAEP
ncbi:unnamed protein product, partial [Heterosigma akashiwo]